MSSIAGSGSSNLDHDGLKVLRLEIDKYKNIDHKVVDIGGHSMFFIGPNAAGKSTLIQAIKSPMDSKEIPSKPIKEGWDRATVRVAIGGTIHGEKKQYMLDLYYTQANQKGKLVVFDEHGAQQKAPATFVKSLVGSISFDIFEFIKKSPAEKVKALKQLSGREHDIDMMDVEIAKAKSALDASRNHEYVLNGQMGNHAFTQEEIDRYENPIDTDPIHADLSAVDKEMANINHVEQKTAEFARAVVEKQAYIEKYKAKILELHQEIANLEVRIEETTQEVYAAKDKEAAGLKWLQEHPKPSAAEISKRLEEATRHNEKHQQILDLSKKQGELIKVKGEIDTWKSKIEFAKKKKADIIARSQLPVKGLSFSDDEIFIDGLPLEKQQINSARLIDVGAEIAMAMNPNLKVIFISDGSLLDKTTTKILLDKIEKRGYQAFIEMVNFSGTDLEIKFSEDVLKDTLA